MKWLILLLLCIPVAFAYNISVESQITTVSGTVSTGSYLINFSVYNSTDSLVFTNTSNITTDSNGRFHQFYDLNYSNNDSLYWTWKIGTDTETNKSQVGYVPYAINAQKLQGKDLSYFAGNDSLSNYATHDSLNSNISALNTNISSIGNWTADRPNYINTSNTSYTLDTELDNTTIVRAGNLSNLNVTNITGSYGFFTNLGTQVRKIATGWFTTLFADNLNTTTLNSTTIKTATINASESNATTYYKSGSVMNSTAELDTKYSVSYAYINGSNVDTTFNINDENFSTSGYYVTGSRTGGTNTLALGLQNYWSFDTNANDLKSSNNGLESGGVVHNDSGCLQSGCYKFDGIDDSLNFSALSMGTAGSLGCWIHANNDWPSVAVGDGDGIFDTNPNDLGAVRVYSGGLADDKVRFETGGDGAALSDNLPDFTNVWHHIAVLWDATTLYLYVDGRQNASYSYTYTPNSISEFIIGYFNNPTAGFNGSIDECGYWNVKVSDSDMTALYNSGNGLAYGSFSSSTSSGYLELGYNLASDFASMTLISGNYFLFNSSIVNFTDNLSGNTYFGQWNGSTNYWTKTEIDNSTIVRTNNGSYVKTSNTSYVLTSNGSYVLTSNNSYVQTNNGSYVLTSNTSYVKTDNASYALHNTTVQFKNITATNGNVSAVWGANFLYNKSYGMILYNDSSGLRVIVGNLDGYT